MIDLSHNRAAFLGEIGTPTPAQTPLREPTDPRVTTEDAVVRLRGHKRTELFPILEVILSGRYANVPRLQVIRDLLMPLSHALGNAFKHGNGGDAAKTIAVELVLTRKGVLAAITDEGPGFDVRATFQRFLARESYFANAGDGFRNLHRADSLIGFDDGGRTVLLCFRPSPPTLPSPNFPHSSDASDPETCSADRAAHANGRARGEGCRPCAAQVWDAGECAVRVVLSARDAGEGSPPQKILAGRLHATRADAMRDLRAAMALCEAGPLDRVRVPQPVARDASDPRLVFYDFHPWMNLWEYLAYWNSVTTVQHAARRIGRALAALHRSQGSADRRVRTLLSADLERADPAVRAPRKALRLPSGLGDGSAENCGGAAYFLNRPLTGTLHTFALERQSWTGSSRSDGPAPARQRVLTLIHGAFGWDCVHYGVDNRFYFQRFERCRRGDPGLDLGGFAADLLCFSLARDDGETYRQCCAEFMDCYNAAAEFPVALEALPSYVALALVERLQRVRPRTRAWTGHLIAALAVASQFAEADVCPP